MSAYVIIKIKTENPALLKDYQAVAPAIIEQFQGKFLARGGEVERLEGTEEVRRTVIIEFPSLEIANAFYDSEAYQHAISLREGAATAEILAVGGIP
ncbi:MAG: hypothetical protein ISEC1_P1213 [Thiomicrorhabdus sp.]|nr:MAG: hypothetical protein ISEC1_P1213 [Thiomicrorhabdus sp.]